MRCARRGFESMESRRPNPSGAGRKTESSRFWSRPSGSSSTAASIRSSWRTSPRRRESPRVRCIVTTTTSRRCWPKRSEPARISTRARVVSADGEAEPTPRPLNVDLPDLIAAAVASRSLTVLWQREARYLNEGDRAEVRRRINAIVAGMRDSVLLEVPGLSPQHSELRAWAVSSTLTSLGRHNLTLPADELKERLYQACMAAARTPPVCELRPLDTCRARRGRCAVLPLRDPARRGRATVPCARLSGRQYQRDRERGRNRGPWAVPLVLLQAGHSGCARPPPR